MKSWEYKLFDSNDAGGSGGREQVEQHLNSLGAEGWEILHYNLLESQVSWRCFGVAKREISGEE
jgi:hypothetical protein